MIDEKLVKDEKHLRALINKGLKKEVHPGTKSNVDYIHHILEETYRSGQTYNVTDLKPRLITFAASSSNQAPAALKLVQTMKFASEDAIETMEALEAPDTFKSEKGLNAEKEVIFDVEVFPNLFVVSWKYSGAPKESIATLINPSAHEIEKLMSMKLVGFNVRRYDNHILYGAFLGENNQQLYERSKRIISGDRTAMFPAAYNISYTDIYDYSSKKQGLKKWEIELKIDHMELGLPWDEPVPKELWEKVAKYCENDVEATDAVHQHLEADYIARQILAELSGLSVNATTQQHTAKIVFGDNRKPQESFVYTDLSEMFPGYTHGWKTSVDDENPLKIKKTAYESTYMGEVVGEGGLVRATPGMYENVVVLDVESMHPTSIGELKLFGEYTEKYMDLLYARIAIKHERYDEAKQMLGGKLARFLNNPEQAEALSYALKIVVNIVYGLTSAKFENAFRDPRNIDNIVAKRGALYMMELRVAVENKGFQVIHIKTDSIKIPNATPEIIQFVKDHGKEYGYNFEHEATYDKMCLVNDAVYIAHVAWAQKAKKIGTWEAVGAQFKHPYVYKYLFSKEAITFDDKTETKQVAKGAMFLDYNGLDDTPGALSDSLNENGMRFVGRTGRFCPVLPGTGGGVLLRIDDEGKQFAVTGTKEYYWLESEILEGRGDESIIDDKYFRGLVDAAVEQIKKYGDYEAFVS